MANNNTKKTGKEEKREQGVIHVEQSGKTYIFDRMCFRDPGRYCALGYDYVVSYFGLHSPWIAQNREMPSGYSPKILVLGNYNNRWLGEKAIKSLGRALDDCVKRAKIDVRGLGNKIRFKEDDYEIFNGLNHELIYLVRALEDEASERNPSSGVQGRAA